MREEAIDPGIVPRIGWTTVPRILTRGDVRPHLVRGWLHSPDPQFREKVTEICDLYHCDGPTRRWSRFNRRHGGRFVFHYTPKHASWVNQVELFFSIVHRQCLRHGDFHSQNELRAALLGFIAYWNRERAHAFQWNFTGDPLQNGGEARPRRVNRGGT